MPFEWPIIIRAWLSTVWDDVKLICGRFGSLLPDRFLRRFLGKLAIILVAFALACVWFYCDRQDEMREIRGRVYGVVENINE